MRSIKNKNIKWWIKIGSFVALFALITIFTYEKMCFVFQGVKIEASIEQKENSELSIIKGRASKATYITLNGREIFIDKEGNFSETISLLPGYQVVSINAQDKFGKTAEKQFKLVKEPNAEAIAFRNKEIIR